MDRAALLFENPHKPSLSATDAAIIGALAFLSIVAQGHNFGVGNNHIYIGWMLRLGSPPALLNDWYLSTSPMHPFIIYPLIRLHEHLPLDWTFLAAHTLTRLLFCAGVYLTAFWMFGSRTGAILAVAFNILFPRISLGGHFAQASHFEANFLGFALATLAFAFFIRGRTAPRAFVIMGIFTGLTLLIHFFIGVSLAAILAIALLIDVRRGDLHWQWLVMPTVAALAIASPSIWSIAQSLLTDQPAMTPGQVANVLAFRHPHHHAPFTWPQNAWIIMGLYVAIWLVFFHKHLTSLEVVTFIWTLVTCIAFIVCMEFHPFGPVAYFQFFRQTVFFTIFLSIHMGGWCARIIDERPRQPFLGALHIVLAMALIVTYRFPFAFIPTAIAAIIVPMVVKKFKFLPRHKDYIGPTSMQETLAWSLLFAGIGLFVLGAMGYLNPYAERLRKQPHFAREVRAANPEIAEACAWAKENTPGEAVFLIPPDLEEFRVLSQRAVVVDWKNVPYRNAELRDWFDRIARTTNLASLRPFIHEDEIRGLSISDDDYTTKTLESPGLMMAIRTLTPIELRAAYEDNTEISVDFLARHYGADYVVARRSFPKSALFSNSQFHIYQVK